MASSITIKCDKCCGATCQTCGFESEDLVCTNQPDTVAISHPFYKGDTCNGRIVREDLDCAECVKCNRDNYDWVPDESTICENESFIQERGGDYPECKMFQDWIGTKDCQPPKDATCEDCGYYSDGGFCSGIPDHVAITQYFNPKETCGEKQFAEFTACFECVKCNRDNYPWEPDPSTKCLGVEFQQTKKGDYPECTIVRIEFGTSTDEGCNYWT